MKQVRLCEVEGCNEKHHGKGLCQKHYRRVSRNGTTERTSQKAVDYRQWSLEDFLKDPDWDAQKFHPLRLWDSSYGTEGVPMKVLGGSNHFPNSSVSQCQPSPLPVYEDQDASYTLSYMRRKEQLLPQELTWLAVNGTPESKEFLALLYGLEVKNYDE